MPLRSICITRRRLPRDDAPPVRRRRVYDAAVRRIAIVCVVLAGARASAQVPGGPPAAVPAVPDVTKAGEVATPPPRAVVSAPTTPAAAQDRAAAEERCANRDPDCDWPATLSTLERASVTRALAAHGYEAEPSPWGKVIGAVRIYNEQVFAEGNTFLRFFNHFHVTTKESTIRSEAVVAPGQVWDQDRIDETARLIRDPLWTSVVAVIPVKSPTPNTVDVLIVTRDIWSLRFNTQYTYQQGKLTNLVTSLSENNFLGRRDVLSAALTMDQGAIAFGPLFIDKNLLGEHLDLRIRVDDIVTRDDLTKHSRFHNEGSDSTITLSRPLWSLASEWAGGATFTHRFAISRQFQGTQLRTYEYTDPVTGQMSLFDRKYESRVWSATAFVTRQWGSGVKQQLTLGHTVASTQPRVLGDFTGDAMARAAFIHDVLPRPEVTSVPYLQYAMYTPRYRTLRNIATFDLAEDLRTGPDVELTVGFGLEALGSDRNFPRWSSSVGWTFPWGREGFLRVAGGLAGRYLDGKAIDNTTTALVRGATPPIAGLLRLHAQTQLSARLEDTQNGFYAIGSDSGLRGFAINEFTGQRLYSLQIEARSLPYPVWVLRLGAVVFYDVGGAARTLRQLSLHQDAGLGLRILVPQTSAQLLKFDFAVPFDGAGRGALRFLAGFGSEF